MRPGQQRHVSIEKGLGPDGRVALVRLDRGDKLNALSPAAMRELRTAALAFEDDVKTSVVILTGNGSIFSAGYDLKDSEARANRPGRTSRRPQGRPPDVPRLVGHGAGYHRGDRGAVHRRRRRPGGVPRFSVLRRECDFRIPEVALGMNMSWGSLPRLLALMGPARTKQAAIASRRPTRASGGWLKRLSPTDRYCPRPSPSRRASPPCRRCR